MKCPVCGNLMYLDNDNVFLRCTVNSCNTKIINIPGKVFTSTDEDVAQAKEYERNMFVANGGWNK